MEGLGFADPLILPPFLRVQAAVETKRREAAAAAAAAKRAGEETAVA